jgi:hypothetical protein
MEVTQCSGYGGYWVFKHWKLAVTDRTSRSKKQKKNRRAFD